MSGILDAALDDELIERNPAVRILRCGRDQGEKFRPSPLSIPKQRRLLEAARGESFERYALFLMALRTGVRRSELLAPQWGDIQFRADDEELGRFIEVK